MPMTNGLVADSERFRDMREGSAILAYLADRLRSFGATHVLVTGLPLPGRPLEPLILHCDWGELRVDRSHSGAIDPSDPVLRLALRARGAFASGKRGEDGFMEASPLVRLVGAGRQVHLVGVPIHRFPPYQGCVIAAGAELAVDMRTMLALEHFCAEAFHQMLAIGFIEPDRPGDLSERERRVVELSAVGKTANEIADMLEISQRTVHAHLKNASEKLRASNKTQTVVEALRYGQICV